MSTGCQEGRKKDRRTNRQKDRLFSFNKTKVVQNGNRMSERQDDRQIERKTERLLRLVIKTNVIQNVHRMSKSQSDRQEDIQCARQTDRVTE